MKKRTISLLLALCMVLQLCSSMAFATTLESDITYPISGKCGMSLTWTLDADGTMTISGSGDMFDYSFDEDNEEIPYRETPWLDLSEDIRKIVIEEGVTSIGSYAFSYLDNLTAVEVAASVTQVSGNAFHSYEGTVPCNVVFLGDAPAISATAVSECYNLRGIFMEDKLGWDTLLEPSDYYYAGINWFGMDKNGIIESGTCDENLSWTISADFTLTISGNGKLVWGIWPMAAYTTLIIEEGITSIGDYAFCMLGNLKKVTIPSTVTEIGERAFDECYSISEITFRGDAPAMHEYAFNYAGYYDGTTAYYPEGNDTWTADVRQNYGGTLTWLALPMDDIEDGEGDSFGGDIGTEEGGTAEPEQPEGITWSISADGTILTIEGTGPMPDYEYIEIDYWGQYTTPWYEYAANITEVIIGDGITRIGANAFGEMWSLTKLTIGASVAELAEGVFQSCYALGELALSADNTHFCLQDGILFNAEETELLFYPSSLETAVYAVPETVKKIAPYAFYCASYNLTTVGFPVGLTEIGDYAFYYKSLTAITLPNHVITIGDYAFYGNSANSLTIPDSVTSIGDYAFGSIFGLTDVQIGSGLQELGECAFGDCSDLANITVDAGNSAFCAENNVLFTKNKDTLLLYPSCKTGTSYTVPDTVRTIAVRAFCSNSSLTEVILPDGLERIEENAFYYCRNLAKADLPDSVTHLGDYAFGNTALTAVTIPDGVETIGASAFAYAPVTTITIGSGVTTIEERAFSGCTKLTEITFRGNAPTSVGQLAFSSVTATAYYPAGNATWPAFIESYSDYDTHLTWTPVETEAPDTTPPTLTIDGPENGEALRDLYVTFTITAEDASNIASVEMSYEKDGETVTVTQAPYEINLYPLGDRTLEVIFTAADIHGNTATETRSYTIDIYPDAPTDLTAVSTVDGVRLTWTTGSNTEICYVYLQQANGDLTYLDACSPKLTAWLHIGSQTGETYTYVVAAEASSQLMAYSEPITITYVSPDTTAPVITDFWPSTEDKVTFCHDGKLQVAATDETSLDRAEFYADGTLIGSANFGADGIASIDWNCADLSGEVTLTYVVYDKAGNSAEQAAVVTVRPYAAPKTPENLTVENGFRSGTLKWSYSGDLQTLRQFNIYDGDPEGGMLVTTVKGYSYTFRNMEEPCSFKVAAVDIYGNQSFSTEAVTIDPILTENVAPKAVMQLKSLTGLTGKSINFSAAGSSDNDAIAAYAWDFGDGATGEGLNCAHTYTDAGTYTVTLTVTDRSGNEDTAQATVTIVSTLGPDATHAVLTVTVQDGYTAGTPAIQNATVTVYNDDFELAALTDTYGRAELVVPKGSYTMTVVASGFDGKARQIEVTETGASTVYLAQNGVSVVDGDLTVTPMTREEMEEVGIDPNDPANNHVVKQQTTIRFQPMPEVAFDIPIEQIVDALGNMIPDKSKGFGWHTFTPDPPQPDDPEDDEDDDNDDDGNQVQGFLTDPIPPKYDVGVFPVGDSAYMVIYGQTHWLKEMFNVELIVYNNSYAQDIEDCVAELNLPEGLSLAAMLEGEQHEQVYIGQIDYIGKTDGVGTAIGMPTRQVNWYVRGDAEGDYSLTAAVNGMVGGDPFQTTFTTDKSIHVYAGSALLLTVTMPKSAYADQDYVVKFSLNNVSDKPIYNLTFGIDTAQQFVAERMSDGSTGEVEREYSNEDFEGGMTYGLPELAPGKAFNLILKTTFEYEHQFLEWAVGKVPLGAVEVGYQVADAFVTTLEGSTTEIPVEIIIEDVRKDDLFQWIWDETVGAFKDGVKDAVIEFVDDKIFQGVPVAEKGVEIFEVVTNIKDEITEEDAQYIPTVNVTEGVQCVPKNEVDDWLSAFDTYSLRRSAAPGILVWTDAVDAVISEDGRSMTMPSGGRLYTLRLGETAVTPEIDVTTYYVDADGSVQPFTHKLTSDQTYVSGLQSAKHILLEQLTENTFAIPEAEGETVEVSFDGYLISEDNEILLRAANEKWSVIGENTDGLTVMDGKLVIDSEAKAGTYTVQLALEGTDQTFEQTIILTGGHRPGDVDGNGIVDVGDATYLLKFLAGLLPDVTLDPAIADLDGTGTVDVGDVTYLMKMLAYLVPEMQ